MKKRLLPIIMSLILAFTLSGCSEPQIEEIPPLVRDAFVQRARSFIEEHGYTFVDESFKMNFLSIEESEYWIYDMVNISITIDIPDLSKKPYTQETKHMVEYLTDQKFWHKDDDFEANSVWDDKCAEKTLYRWRWGDGDDDYTLYRFYPPKTGAVVTSNGSTYTVGQSGEYAVSLFKDGEAVYTNSWSSDGWAVGNDSGNEYDYNGNNKWDTNEWNNALDDYLTEHGY